MRAIRMTLSLCHSVAEERDLIIEVESRPERRRQEYIRALLVKAVESAFEGMDDLRPSGAAAATHRMVIHLNAEIPADDVIVRFVERSAAPIRRSELLRRLLVQASRLYTPNAATAPRASPTPATKPRPSNAEHFSREAPVSGKATWVQSTEIDVVLPDDEEATATPFMPGTGAATLKRSSESDPAVDVKPARVELQQPAAMPATDPDDDGVQHNLSALAGLFK